MKLKYIFEELRKKYPDPKSELNYSTPYQLVFAVVLSAQTTDKQVNKVTEKLFDIIKVPSDLLKMDFDVFEKAISGVNYYKTKARNLWKMAGMLVEKPLTPPTPSKIDGVLEELMKLPWVGIKTAKVVAHVLWGLPVIAVDTHVHRWWIDETKTPDETSVELEKVVLKKYKDFAHHALVLFGRYVCIARNPKCSECSLKKYCNFYKNK